MTVHTPPPRATPSGAPTPSHSRSTPQPTAPAVTTEVLTVPECWTLLRAGVIGRLAVATDDGPDIFPVNYTVLAEFMGGNIWLGWELYAIPAGGTPGLPKFESDGEGYDVEVEDARRCDSEARLGILEPIPGPSDQEGAFNTGRAGGKEGC